MKSKIKYVIIAIMFVFLVTNKGKCQDASVGSWIVSSSYGNTITSTGEDEDGYMNYRMNFSYDGSPTLELISSDQTLATHSHFSFSVGTYSDCSGALNMYLTDNHYYSPNQQNLNIYDEDILPEAVLLTKQDDIDYQLIYASKINTSGNFHLYYVDLFEDGNSYTYTIHTWPYNMSEGISDVAFSISNIVNDEQYFYTVCGTPNQDYTNTLGLEVYEVTEDGFDFEETLILDSQASEFGKYDFAGYNLEIQDKNNIDDPNIAWITTPITSTPNQKIFIYDEDYSPGDHYFLDLSSINTVGCGRIGGIEFSPFVGEEDYMFVSSENLGLIKINWQTGALIHQYTPTNIDFSHTFIQTAPNGKVYAVSDDGKRFGEIGPNNSFNASAFDYPESVPTAPSSHIDYIEFNGTNEVVKYYSLPDNDQAIYPSFQELLVIDKQSSQNIASLSDMTWDANDGFPNNTLLFEHGFTLRDSVILNVNNMRLEFNQLNNAKVIIEPGSQLILNDSTILTNHHCYESGKWGGIEVWGNPSVSQQDNNGFYDQGYLEMNRSIVEHAQTAVLLGKENDYCGSGGGIIKAYNSSFINNAKAIHFFPYKNEVTFGTTFEKNNEAFFKYCTFDINGNYLDDSDFYKHVDAVQVRGISFRACDFMRSSNENTFQWCSAIEAYSAGISIDEWDQTPSTFYGFYRGINLSDDNSNVTYLSYIKNSEFTNNSIGVELNSMNSVVTITDNIFNVGYNDPDKGICGKSQGFGIFLDESNTFVIQDNEFYKYSNAPSGGEYFGIEAYNTASGSDEIFRNTYSGLNFANHTTDKNYGGIEYEGLAFYCNINSNNNNDLFFTYETLLGSGVQTGQGNEYISAGNVFSQNMGVNEYNIYNDAENGIGYYYNVNEPLEIPTAYNQGNGYVTPHPQTLVAECSGGGISPKELSESEKSNLETEYLTTEAEYQSVASLYESLLDGGSTVELQTEVNTTWPNEMWELRAELLGLSPYLSKEVLITAADKTDVLPESVLFEILSANPEELKKEELMSYLENKEQPLPEYMIEILRQLAAGQSAKTVLLNQKSYYHREKSRAALEMLVCLPFDEILNYNNYRFWLNRLGGLNSDRKIVSSFIEEGNYSDALALANMLPTLYALENDALYEHNYYMEMLNLDITLKQENRSPLQLNGDEYSMLENLAENSKGIAGVKARSILEYFYGQHFCNCVNTSIDENKSSTTSFNPNQFAEAMGLKINADPNPATNWVTFNYQLPIGKEKAVLIIKNIEGKQVSQFIFKNETGQKVWDTRSLKSGAYIYEFSCDELKQSGKVVIIH